MSESPNGRMTRAIETGRSDELRGVRYEDLLRALGGYIDQHGLADVLITQIPDGVLLKGTVIERTPRGAVERITSILFTNDDVLALLQESQRRRGQAGTSPSRLPPPA
jgi:hypothetical protein